MQGFPTIKIFSPGSKTPTDYQGERSAKALANAAVGAWQLGWWLGGRWNCVLCAWCGAGLQLGATQMCRSCDCFCCYCCCPWPCKWRSCRQLLPAAAGQLTSKHVKKVTSLQEAIMFLSSPTTKVRSYALPLNSSWAVGRLAPAGAACLRAACPLLP